jgi:hypothetical protein
MDQKVTPLYLVRKQRSALEIYADFVATFGQESASYPSLADYLRQATFATLTPSIFFEPEPEPDDSDEAILLTRSEPPFASVRLTHLSRSTVYRRLTQTLGFHVRHLG